MNRLHDLLELTARLRWLGVGVLAVGGARYSLPRYNLLLKQHPMESDAELVVSAKCGDQCDVYVACRAALLATTQIELCVFCHFVWLFCGPARSDIGSRVYSQVWPDGSAKS